MKSATILFLFFSVSAVAQSEMDTLKKSTFSIVNLQQGFNENPFQVRPEDRLKPISTIWFRNRNNTVVPSTAISDIGNTFSDVYRIRTKVAGFNVGNPKKQSLSLMSNVGLKGLELKAVGSFSKKRGSTFNFNYKFSVEDMLMNGSGHRLRLITEF